MMKKEEKKEIKHERGTSVLFCGVDGREGVVAVKGQHPLT
jgi:hypothetical protein